MADVVAFLTNSLVSTFLLGYVAVLWFSITVWTAMDIFARTKNWFARIGSVILVAFGFLFGFVLYLIIRPTATTEEQRIRELEEKILENQSRSFACPSCRELAREDFLFCPNCGINIRRECSSCNRLLDIAWVQCPYCGTSVGPKILPTIQEATKLLQAKNNGSFFGIFKRFFAPPWVTPVEIKRKRGRPRKIRPEEPMVKRSRGRPRKDETQINV